MYYSRNDLYSVELLAVGSNKSYSISKRTIWGTKDAPNNNIQTQDNVNITDTQWFKATLNNKSYLYIKPEIVFSEGKAAFPNNKLFTIYRTIINVYNKQPLAVIAITCNTSGLNKIISDFSLENSEMLSIYDDMGRIFYVSNNYLIQPQVLNSMSDYLEKTVDGQDDGTVIDNRLLVSSIKNNWKMVKLISLETINKKISQTRNLFIFIICIASFISVMFIFFITKPLTSSLKKLMKQMSRAGKGDFKTKVEIKGSNEVVELANRYNSMISEINELIEENYLAEINQKNAQLKALESQINPHFLYNSLQVISAKAIASQQKDICKMTEALAFNMRYAFKQEGMVTVEMEMKHIRNYLLLQEARFEERLSIDIKVSEEAGSVTIPKISIYTLVENSAEHGLENTIKQVEIKINVYIENGYLAAIVSDNGQGITPERLEEIRGWFGNNNMEFEDNENIGLRNLNGRIKLLYGNRAHLTIESTQNVGTTATMYLPLSTEQEASNV
jgi:two-component system sensor histidine kinase YesM